MGLDDDAKEIFSAVQQVRKKKPIIMFYIQPLDSLLVLSPIDTTFSNAEDVIRCRWPTPVHILKLLRITHLQ